MEQKTTPNLEEIQVQFNTQLHHWIFIVFSILYLIITLQKEEWAMFILLLMSWECGSS